MVEKAPNLTIPVGDKGGDKFVDLITKWHFEQQEAELKHDAAKFDFLNNPGQIRQLREENRDTAVEEWSSLDP